MNELSSNDASWFRSKLVERIQGHLWKKETLFVEASGGWNWALWEGPEVPFLPCQAELGTLQWAAPTTAIPVQTSIFPCFLEPFLPAPSHSLIELVQLVPKPLACIANIALPSRGFVKWMRVSVSSWPVRTSRTCRLIHSSEHSAQHIRCLINEVFME